jgi:hypothetical protein
VPSERVFSSSAVIDTKQQNQTSPLLMEALQMLKFNYKKSRLNLMAEWQSPPILPEDEDWLRQLAAADENDRSSAIQAIKELFGIADDI